jgi:hypothetical protein
LKKQGYLSHCRNDRSISHKIAKPSFKYVYRKIVIGPVFHSQIKKLKNKPDKNRNESRKKKILYGVRKRRGFSSPKVYAVHYKNKEPPGKTKEPSFHKRNIKNKEECGKHETKKTKV